MSYDIYLRGDECATCGHMPEGPDGHHPTYNLTPIFDLALTGEPLPNPEVGEFGVVLLKEKTDRPRGLRILSGRKARDTVPMLENGLKRLEDPAWRERFAALEPANKWGTHADAIRVFNYLLHDATTYPEHTWSIQ